jgi:nitrite reductase/ring-hydroxylating ferredoxin subunit
MSFRALDWRIKEGNSGGSQVANYVEVANLDELPPGRSTVVTIEGKDIGLFNVDGVIYATDDACRHQGLSLGNSKLDGKIVTCSGHGWSYDVTTGSTLNSPGYGVAAYPVKVVDRKIMVAIDTASNPAV